MAGTNGYPISVAVIDPSPMFLEGVVQAIKRCNELKLLAGTANVEDMGRVLRHELLDVLIIGDPMPSFEAVLKRLQRRSGCRVLVLTDLEDPQSLSSPLGAEVSAYILKGVSGLELVATVKEVHGGRSFVTADPAARFKASAGTVLPYRARKQGDFLSHRERQVLHHVAKGLSNKEIATLLGLSIVTVKHYMTHLFKKMQVRNRIEALRQSRLTE